LTGRIHYAAGPSAARANETVPKVDIGEGILLQVIADGANLNAVHWNIPDGDVVPEHAHIQEQFGYVIRGALELTVSGQTFVVGAGDSYVIPPNAPHGFRAQGQTEAIDVFSPLRDLSTAGGRHR
jgi:quercetin dioxygenase-like cupin family protein